MSDIINFQYPIGKASEQSYFERSVDDPEAKRIFLSDIVNLPNLLENSILNLDEEQLNTPYRDGGWTIKQVVHHVADSHANAYIRFKLGLTEDNPTIKPYEEAAWANLDDSKNVPINVSLTWLHAMHIRLYETIKNLTKEEWERTVLHPEQKKEISLWDLLKTYSWHGKHHTAHITELRKRHGW